MSQPIHILLIEDDEEDYMITRDIIDDIPDRRYRLDWVASFEEGIAAIENKKYDVYLLDYRLGREDGVELLRQVDAPAIESPFILLTGQDDIALDKEAMEAGAADFLVKGDISANVLERTIRYAIQQRKTIRQLKKSEYRLKEAQAIGKIGNFELNIPEKKIYWSAELYRIFGYNPQSFNLTVENQYNQVHPDDREMLEAKLKRIQKEKKGFSFGYRVIHLNGEVRYVYGSRDVELDKHGKVIRIFGTIRDVTEQKLREAELLIKDIAISSSPLPIAFADLENKLTFVNQAFLDLWGYENAAEIIGQPTFNFGENSERVKEIMQSIQTTGQWIGEDTVKKKDGSPIDLYINTSLVKDELGTPICILGTFLDVSEVKKTQQILVEKTKTLHASLELAQIGSWQYDLATNRITLDNKAKRIFDIPSNKKFITYEEFIALFLPEDQQDIIYKFQHAIATKSACKRDCAILIGEKEIRWISSEAQALTDEKGTVIKLIGVSLNITAQKQYQETIEKEKETAQMYLDIAGSLVVIIDKTGNITLLNQRGEEILGVSEEEILGENWFDNFIPKKEREKVRQVFDRLMDKKGKNVEYHENSILNKEGEQQLIWWHNRVLFDDQGESQGTISSGVDITELRETEKRLQESQKRIKNYSLELEQKVKERTAALEESQRKLSEAQAIANIGHWDLIVETKELVYSKGMYKIYDLDEKEPVIYELVDSLTHPEDRDIVKSKIGKAIENNQSITINHRIITPAGQLKYVRSNVQAPLHDENGKITRVFGVLKDITNLKESELQLHEALNKEKELGILKSRFVSMASHEFRTPLSSILSSAELLGMYIEAGKMDKVDKMNRNINRIKNSVRNLTGILNDFLSLEKLEAGKVEVQNTVIQLTDYLEELSEEIKPILRPNQQLLLQFKNIKVVQTDPYLLKNILINLVSNAIKYSPKGEDVTLEISKAKQQLVFKIVDKGIGIPPEDQQHMFSRFFRASNVENIKGTGLGLTIVKRYLDLMGGDIGFESKYGKGSTFFFHIPMG